MVGRGLKHNSEGHIFSVKGREWEAVLSFIGIKQEASESRIMAELLFTAFDRELEADQISGRKFMFV